VSQASCALLIFIPSYATPNSFSHPIKWLACQLSFCRAVVPVPDTHTQSRFFPTQVWSGLNNWLSFQSTDLEWLLHSGLLKQNSRKLGIVGRAGRGVIYCFILTSIRTMAGNRRDTNEKLKKKVKLLKGKLFYFEDILL